MRRAGGLAIVVLTLSLLTISAVLAPSLGLHLANGSSATTTSGAVTVRGGPTPASLARGVQGQASPVASQGAPLPAANANGLLSSQSFNVGPRLVQSAYAFSAGPSISCQFASSVSTGDLLIVSLGGLGTEALSSDSLSLTWSHYSLENTLGYPFAVDSWSYVYYAVATVGGPESVSFSVNSYGNTLADCYEFSAVSAAVDAESSGTSTGYLRAPPFSVSSYSPSAGDLVFASGYQTEVHYCYPPDFTPGAGYAYAGVDNCQGYGEGSSSGTLGDEYALSWGGGATTSPMTSNEGPGAESTDGQEISIAFRPATVAVAVSLSPQDGAPGDSATVACQGGGGTYTAGGGTQYFWCTAALAVTVTLAPGGGNYQWCFPGECVASVSFTACPSGVCPTQVYAYYEQLQSTFQEALSIGTFAPGLTWAYAGYQSGSLGALVCASTPGPGGTSAGCAGWSDYGQPVTAPASPSGESPGIRFEDSSGSPSTAGIPTTGGSPFTVDYYEQYGEAVRYSLLGGGSPVAPTFSYTSLGTAGVAYTMTTSPATLWLDYGSNWTVGPSLLTGSGTTERWLSTSPLSGTATASGTVDPSYYHQYTESIAYGVACDSGATCGPPTLTYYQFGSTKSSVLSTAAQSFWMDSGSVASVSTSITDNLNDAYTPYLSSWLVSGAGDLPPTVQYWSGL